MACRKCGCLNTDCKCQICKEMLRSGKPRLSVLVATFSEKFGNVKEVSTNEPGFSGRLEFEESFDGELKIKNIFCDEDSRGKGLSAKLLQWVIKDSTKTIKATLIGDNAKALSEATGLAPKEFKTLSEKDMINTIKKTPAYKIRKRLGFGKIVGMGFDEDPDGGKKSGLVFVVCRDSDKESK